MTSILLDPDRLRHPCEAAFEALLTTRRAASVLFLTQRDSGSTDPEALVMSGQFQPITSNGSAAQRTGDEAFTLRCEDTLVPPLPDATCDLVVLRIERHPDVRAKSLGGLLAALRRVIAPHGEILLIYGTPGRSNHTPNLSSSSRTQTARYRLVSRTRALLLAFDVRWRITLTKALGSNGFVHTEWFVPEYTTSGLPCRLHLLEGAPEVRQHLDWRQRLRLLSRRCVLVRASTLALRPSLLQEALANTRRAVAADTGPITIESILISPKEKLVAMARAGTSEFVLRIPFSAHAEVGCRQNMQALRDLQAVPGMGGVIPQPLLEDDHTKRYFSAETRIRGMPLRHLPQGSRELKLAEALLRALNPAETLVTGNLEGALFDELVSTSLALIGSKLATPECRNTLDRFFRNTLSGSTMKFGISHGDFSVRNIYLENGRISGVIDWDEGLIRGLPVLDAIGHLLSRQSRRGNGFADSIHRLATRQWPVDYELDFLDRCYTYCGVEQDQHFALVMLQWLRVVGNQSQHWFAQRDAFADEYILPVMALIADRTKPGTAADSVAKAVRPGS